MKEYNSGKSLAAAKKKRGRLEQIAIVRLFNWLMFTLQFAMIHVFTIHEAHMRTKF